MAPADQSRAPARRKSTSAGRRPTSRARSEHPPHAWNVSGCSHVDFKQGYQKLDGNTRVRCAFFGGRCRENVFPQEFDPRRIAAIQSSGTLIDYLIDDAGFTKLREVSATYTLPAIWAAYAHASTASISLAGRNLKTWTDYGGLEPEAFFLGGTRGGSHSIWEQTVLPQLAQWVVSVNLGF